AIAHAGIGEARIDTTMLGQSGLEARDHSLFLRHIDNARADVRPMRLQPFQRVRVLLGVRAPDFDGGARLRERFGHAEANAAIAARDQGDAASEMEKFVAHAVSYEPPASAQQLSPAAL